MLAVQESRSNRPREEVTRSLKARVKEGEQIAKREVVK